jgi:dTMP kinase
MKKMHNFRTAAALPSMIVVLTVIAFAGAATAQLGDALKGVAEGAAQDAAVESGAAEKAAEADQALEKSQKAADRGEGVAADAQGATEGEMMDRASEAAAAGAGAAAQEAARGADVKAAGQKGVAVGVDTMMKGGSAAPVAAEKAKASEKAASE